jgi:general nucleoside transport system ATP-binding protein
MSEEKAPEIVVEMHGITKRFPGVLANDKVDFDLRRSEIHALLGENGAGKSTLMSVLAGMYHPEAGSIVVNGKPVSFASPRDAIQAGIGMIHQHFMLVPSQTVTENILLGLDRPRFRMNLSTYDQEIAQLSERFHLHVDPHAKIWQLSVGEQQRVEILKMLYRGAQVLIMDEPTAVLAPLEIEELFKTLRSMVSEGKSIIFISHKLNEVLEIADRISVLRDGRVTANGISAEGVTRSDLARLMVGRNVILFVEKKPMTPGEVVLSVENVHAESERGLPAVRGISLNVRGGEIVGLAGVAGNGQRELADAINGLRKCQQGRVLLQGEEVSNKPIRKNIRGGMAYVPEDRTHVGSAPSLSITDNVIMKKYQQPPIGRGMTVDARAAEKFANQLKEQYDIVVPNVKTQARLLSGGNLQRVILAREMSTMPKVMIAVQPTRGLDVGAIEGVHNYLLAEREAGAGVLLISEELEELLALCDRIYVIYEGQIMGEVSDGNIETIGLMMTGTPLEQIRQQGAATHV